MFGLATAWLEACTREGHERRRTWSPLWSRVEVGPASRALAWNTIRKLATSGGATKTGNMVATPYMVMSTVLGWRRNQIVLRQLSAPCLQRARTQRIHQPSPKYIKVISCTPSANVWRHIPLMALASTPSMARCQPGILQVCSICPEAFSGARDFNGNIENWNVASVTSMFRMFYGARRFRGSLKLWNVAQVEDMNQMFSNAYKFNGDLGDWNVRSVTDFYKMFDDAWMFDADITNWGPRRSCRSRRVRLSRPARNVAIDRFCSQSWVTCS